MTTFTDSAHVNAGKLASALADRGYLSPDQASQMCDGFVSLHNMRQAQDAFNNAAFGALSGSNPTQPLPPEYPDSKAFFTVTFFYNETPPR